MSHFDDFDDVLATEFDDDLIEALIRGDSVPELPADLTLTGRVLRAAHGQLPGDDRTDEAEVVAAMITAMGVTPITAARSSRRGRRLVVAVAAAVGVLGVGGVAAAAGGLPTPIQSFVHDTLSHVGVSVPSTEDEPVTPEPQPAPDDTAGVQTPQQPGVTAGRSESAPGQSGDTPGQSDATPGKSGSAPGQSGNTPGQSDAVPPGQSGNTPGQSGDNPGRSDDNPGDSVETPGQSGEDHGQSGSAPGQSKK